MYNCPMKHAYLIIAHHEFDILNKLIQAIDDERNDIFIHFDKKVRNCPSLTALCYVDNHNSTFTGLTEPAYKPFLSGSIPRTVCFEHNRL